MSTSSTTSSMFKAFNEGKGRIKPNISRIGLSLPSIEITKDPFLGFSSLIVTLNACSVLASSATFTRLALVLNAFQDLQCSMEMAIGPTSSSILGFLVTLGIFVAFETAAGTFTVTGSSETLSIAFLLLLLVFLELTDMLRYTEGNG